MKIKKQDPRAYCQSRICMYSHFEKQWHVLKTNQSQYFGKNEGSHKLSTQHLYMTELSDKDLMIQSIK